MNWKLALLWLGAVVTATFMTWQIVNVADSRVSAQPVEAAPLSTTTSVSTSTSAAPTTTSSVVDGPPTTNNSSPTTTGTSSSTPTSTSQPTATTAGPEWSVRSVNTQGGTVVVRYRPGEVELQSATPAPGFDAEIDDAGPPEVRVEFEAEEIEVRVEIQWDEGGLTVDVEEK